MKISFRTALSEIRGQAHPQPRGLMIQRFFVLNMTLECQPVTPKDKLYAQGVSQLQGRPVQPDRPPAFKMSSTMVWQL
ncbi:hypothetical protein DZG01_07795 [Pseudomonas fluorescens]|nr:hypothetical protein DZG01_07795 [Pseudomonas fluorescens]